MRIRTKTTGRRLPGRNGLPRARVTLPLVGLVVAALAVGPLVDRAAHPNEATVMGMASTRGLLPILGTPTKGTEVFQWDPELVDVAPTDLGRVVDPRALYEGHRYVLVRHPNPRRPGLYLGIQPGEMRYWVRKPSP